jgi:NAD(P)-dependent dehydrogenase (short-subunit alcohol dehydrogenase family)
MGQTERVAIVTGANRGLGFETCRQLAQQGYQVILTSRDKRKGEQAVKEIAKSGLLVLYHPLDVQSETSVTQLRDFVLRDIGRLDVLVNNAAVLLDESRGVLGTKIEIFRNTMDTNLFGPLRMCQAFVPIMLEHDYGRVVNVSSDAGQLARMTDYAPAYAISKTALSALTVHVANAARGMDILVNAVHPGWVRTDMGGRHAPRSVEDGADTIVWLATLPAGGPTGKFFCDRTLFDW